MLCLDVSFLGCLSFLSFVSLLVARCCPVCVGVIWCVIIPSFGPFYSLLAGKSKKECLGRTFIIALPAVALLIVIFLRQCFLIVFSFF